MDGFDSDAGGAFFVETEFLGGAVAEVDDALAGGRIVVAGERPAVVDPHHH